MTAAAEHEERSADVRFTDAVEAVRTGYVIARSKKAAAQWASRRLSRPGTRGLSGKNLDAAVQFIGMKMPGKVRTEERPN